MMTDIEKQAMDLFEMLPEDEQLFAVEILKRLVRAWDPDFTKVTPAERERMEIAEKELENGEFFTEEEFRKDIDD